MTPTRSTAAFQRAHSTTRCFPILLLMFYLSLVTSCYWILFNSVDIFSRLKNSHDEGRDQRKFGGNRMWWRTRQDKQSTFANELVQFEHDGTPRRRRCILLRSANWPKAPTEKQLPIGRSFKFNLEFSRKWMATHFRYLNSCLKHWTFLTYYIISLYVLKVKRISYFYR